MPCLLINNEKYIQLMNDNSLKNKSFEDEIYFSLRDIFLNIDEFDNVLIANKMNRILTGNISFEERGDNFEYAIIIKDPQSSYVNDLYEWLYKIEPSSFRIYDGGNENVNMNEYMKFDDWWEQFLNSRDTLRIFIY
jgi:hypothetical protein